MIPDRYPVTQTWEQHLANAGPTLGGVDWAMPIGTPLPTVPGELEWITPHTRPRPAWYNPGLGNVAAFRRGDGTRTIYAHCSTLVGRVPLSGNSGKSTGPHLHAHDILSDGVTRARPFSTIRKRDTLMRILWKHPSTGLHAVADPVERTYSFVDGFTLDALLQDGAVVHPLESPEWEAELGGYREIRSTRRRTKTPTK